MTAQAFADALDAISAANRIKDNAERIEAWRVAHKAFQALTPEGLALRPEGSSVAVNLAKAESAVARFYVNEYRQRVRSPRLTALAWAGIVALSAALKPASERHSWRALAPVIAAALESGTDKGRDAAKVNLRDMAEAADKAESQADSPSPAMAENGPLHLVEMPGGGSKVIVSREAVASFNRAWPCSTLRSTRAYWFEHDRSGDLVDSDVPESDDGPAASAMADDCKAFALEGVTPAWAPGA